MSHNLLAGGPIWIAIATAIELAVFGLAFWIGYQIRLKQK